MLLQDMCDEIGSSGRAVAVVRKESILFPLLSYKILLGPDAVDEIALWGEVVFTDDFAGLHNEANKVNRPHHRCKLPGEIINVASNNRT
ncbi:MAG TPA: hypothetical protein EYG11_18050 [Candidatus Latescibacteria bacterium]|nr:hypothetical protein [Candidatus Handelsmanbacteria bacterium]HIL10607.1 hypothetical protein [Candidatus Latescibacterota bacterium]